MKTRNLFFVSSVAVMATLFTALPAVAAMDALLDMSEKIDQLDMQDHSDFVELNDKANACTRARDFGCAEKKIAEAAKSAGNSQDKNALRLAQQNLTAERQLVDDEKKAEKQKQLAEVQRREEEKRQRIAQQDHEQEQREHNANIKMGMAIFGSVVIGQSMKGYSAVQRSDVVDAYVKDVANDTGGSNLNEASNKVIAQRTNEHNSQMRALAEQRQTNAVAAEAAENERLMKAAYESTHPNGGHQQAGKQQQSGKPSNSPSMYADASNAKGVTRQSSQIATAVAADNSWKKCGPNKKCLVGDGYQSFCSGPADNSKPMCKSECQMSSLVIYHDTNLAPGAYIPGDYKCPTGSCNVINSCD